MNILYISHSLNSDMHYQDASVRYRCFNPAEVLSNHNITADVTTIDRVSLKIIERYDVLIFHRPAIGKKLEKLVNKAKQLRRVMIADYDDLIFNPNYAEQSPGFLNNQYLLNSIKASFKKRFDALSLFDRFSVSTNPLAAEIKKIRPSSDIAVIHNYLSDTWFHDNNLSDNKSHEGRRITYLPGSSSHHHDFKVVEDLLSRYLSDKPDVTLRIVGPLSFDMEKFNKNQLELMPLVPYPLLPGLINDSWVTIAPFAKNIFNNCKSGLKYFESAAFGIPVISSPIDDMRRFKSDSLHLADTCDEWLNAFDLLSDKTYYDRCTASGKNHVIETCLASNQAGKDGFFQKIINI